MITKHNIIVVATSVIIAVAIPVVYLAKKPASIACKTFQLEKGWGYDIVENGKLIIHQKYIPAIADKKEFGTEIQARRTGELVIMKLKNNKFPTVSKAEVDQICGDNNPAK